MLALPPELILSAYANGLFPMAKDRHDPTIHWLDPVRRGVIPLDRFHLPRSLRKVLRRKPFEIRVDTAFEKVIHACAEATPDRPRTWLNDELIGAYIAMARRGFAHSVECWREGRLVGGLYGVALGGAFFGESMFSRERDASKVALVELVCRLRAGGFELLDTQFVTEHLKRFGAIEISRQEYRIRLRRAVVRRATFPTGPGSLAYSEFGRSSPVGSSRPDEGGARPPLASGSGETASGSSQCSTQMS
jgi:leucyl/phenylalanyl-tRNA--protein transferase